MQQSILKSFHFVTSTQKKPKLKRIKSICLFSELPFYEELNVIKTTHAFRGYEMSYKVGTIEKKDPIKQLEAKNQILKTSY